MTPTEVISEFFPSSGLGVDVGGEIGLPPGLSCSPQQTGTIQNFLSIIALGSVQLTLQGMHLILGIHGVSRMSEHKGMTSHELCTLISGHLHLQLGLRFLLNLLHGYLNCLSLHEEHMLY
jgi:hypothetical protein